MSGVNSRSPTKLTSAPASIRSLIDLVYPFMLAKQMRLLPLLLKFGSPPTVSRNVTASVQSELTAQTRRSFMLSFSAHSSSSSSCSKTPVSPTLNLSTPICFMNSTFSLAGATRDGMADSHMIQVMHMQPSLTRMLVKDLDSALKI